MLQCFVFVSRSKATHIAPFLFSDSCFSAAQTAKISLLPFTVASLGQPPILHARYNCQPSVLHRRASRSQQWNSKTLPKLHLSQFRTPYYTNQRQHSNRPKRKVSTTMRRYQTYNFRFQLLRQKIVSAYNIAAVCCNSHVQENELSSIRFTSIQGKTILWLSEFRVSFWHPKTAWKTLYYGIHTFTNKVTKTLFLIANIRMFWWKPKTVPNILLSKTDVCFVYHKISVFTSQDTVLDESLV